MRFKSSVLKSLDALFSTAAVFVSHFGGGVGATFQEFSWTQDSSLCLEFLDDARLALHGCGDGKREVVIESVGNQRSLVWALSGLLVGLFVPIIWIVSARCLMRRRAKSESVPVEQDDRFGKNGSREVAPARRGGGLVA